MKNFKKHLIILGSARSGTSWLSENLAKPFRYRMLFEPENELQSYNKLEQFYQLSSESRKQLSVLMQKKVVESFSLSKFLASREIINKSICV